MSVVHLIAKLVGILLGPLMFSAACLTSEARKSPDKYWVFFALPIVGWLATVPLTPGYKRTLQYVLWGFAVHVLLALWISVSTRVSHLLVFTTTMLWGTFLFMSRIPDLSDEPESEKPGKTTLLSDEENREIEARMSDEEL